jgi:hypothetical protein
VLGEGGEGCNKVAVAYLPLLKILGVKIEADLRLFHYLIRRNPIAKDIVLPF